MNIKVTPTKIGSRELVRNFKKIKTAVSNGEVFDVLDHGVTAFRIVPTETQKSKKYTFADFMKFRIKTKVTDSALHVDQYVYGKK